MSETTATVTVEADDITAELAVFLSDRKPDVIAWRAGLTKDGISPHVAISDVRWNGPDLCVTMANGQKFEATFAKVTTFSFEV